VDDRINAKIADPQKRRTPKSHGVSDGFVVREITKRVVQWFITPLSFALLSGGVVEAINFTDITRTTRPGACNFCSKGPPFSTPSTKESNSAKRMGPLCTWRKGKAAIFYQRLSTWHLQLLLLKINAWKMKLPFGSGQIVQASC